MIVRSEFSGLLMFRKVAADALPLAPGEGVLRTCRGAMGSMLAPIVGRLWLTDRRLAFRSGWRNAAGVVNSFAFRDIERAELTPTAGVGVFRQPLTLHTRQGRRTFQVDDPVGWTQALEAAVADQAHLGVGEATAERRVSALEALGGLWRSGVLNAAELAAEKAKVLTPSRQEARR
jgi:hypothetical protein